MAKKIKVQLDALDIEIMTGDIDLIERSLPYQKGSELDRLTKKLAMLKEQLAQGFYWALEDLPTWGFIPSVRELSISSSYGYPEPSE
jgi:hypothetical protein